MCVNEKRRLTIPSDLAYGKSFLLLRIPELRYLGSTGSRGFGTIIPPGSTLVFDVELVSLNPRDEL